VITFPDGKLDALYLAGQLTVFRNVEYFRKFFLARYQHGRPEYKMAHSYLLCEMRNRLWDEKYSV
jgi:hypothetical protein